MEEHAIKTRKKNLILAVFVPTKKHHYASLCNVKPGPLLFYHGQTPVPL